MWNIGFIWAPTTYSWTYPHDCILINLIWYLRTVLTGSSVPESHILASVIIALFMFIVNYLLIPFRRGIQPYRNFRNFNRVNFRNDIYQQDWSCSHYPPFPVDVAKIRTKASWDICKSPHPHPFVILTMQTCILWTDRREKFLWIVNIHDPVKIKRVRSHKTLRINSESKKVCMSAMLPKENDPHDWANYRKLRKKPNF